MKYPAYSKCKNSGVQWLGKVPEHWEVKRLKYLATINDETLPETTDPEFEFFYVDIGSVNLEDGISGYDQKVFENAPSRARRKVKPGDTIVSTVRTYLRAIAQIPAIDFPLIVSTGFAVIRPCKLAENYLAYALRESYFVESVVARSVGVSYPAINSSEIGVISIPTPPLPEQTAIANFLDRETGRIDTLVVKKRRLLALLEEKRTALISRTVTRGLPGDVAREFGLESHTRFKDSGVDWLGDVPEEWEIIQLKWAIMFQRGHDLPADQRENGSIPVVSSAGISAKHNVAIAKGPGIVTGRYGTIGKFHLIKEDYWPLNTTLYSIELRGNNLNFLCFMLEHLSPLVILHSVKSAVPGVDRNDLHPTKIVIPPLPEQTAIATYLDRETAKIDQLKEKIHEAIVRLREYRTALIAAAVTGKIDVRNRAA